jgi:integrase
VVDGEEHRTRYAPATVGRRLRRCKQFFTAARKAGLIPVDPFEDFTPDAMDNPERLVYVPYDYIGKVLEHCANWEWRLLWGLARYAGIRIPSDTEHLTLESVNLEKNFIWIKSPKTEHLSSRGLRRVPIARELMPLLLDAIENLPEGETHLLPILSKRDNLRTQAHRIIKRAGLTPWEKTFQNLRASCETDWMDWYGLRRACNWIGNSPDTAMRHYSIMRDDDFLADTGDFECGEETGAKTGAPTGARQGLRAIAGSRQGNLPKNTSVPDVKSWQRKSLNCSHSQDLSLPRTGLEPVASALGKPRSIQLSYRGV